DNRLEELPSDLFTLPSLASLDVSNNKLRALPCSMWSAPVLRDLNKSASRSPSIDNSEPIDNVPVIGNRAGNAV
ncbi:unnamed protein product, partial [Leptidea sinapis]